MHHFFVSSEQVQAEKIRMEGSDVKHMKNVLRMRTGEKVSISNQCGKRYECVLEAFDEQRAILSIVQEKEEDQELDSRIYLFQGLAKGEKMEWIVQKAVELGVYEIIPVETKRSIVKLDEKKSHKKIERWQTIAQSGAKQSGRGIIPRVHDILSFEKALEYAKEIDIKLIPYECAENMEKTRETIGTIAKGKSVAVFIGPEGGFEESEIHKAMEHLVLPITLGKRILRTETAGIVALSMLVYQLEE